MYGMKIMSLRPVRVLGVLSLAVASFLVLPGSASSAAPTSVSVPISGAVMTVNGTATNFPAAPGAVLSGTYDPSTGAFSGNLVIPGLGQTGTTSLGAGFSLNIAPFTAPVTGTIPQSGSGTLGSVGWSVDVGLTGPTFVISGCSVTIAPMTFATTFDSAAGTLALTATGYSIPAATCTGGPIDESDVNSVLAIPTTATELVLSASDASALRGPQEPSRPTFAG